MHQAHLKSVAVLHFAAWILCDKAKERGRGIDGAHGDAAEGVRHGELVTAAVNHLDAFEAKDQDGTAGLVDMRLFCEGV